MTSPSDGGMPDQVDPAPPSVPVPQYGSRQYFQQQPFGEQSMASGFPPPYGGYPQPRSTNGLAIASLILAFLCAPAGIVCGIIGLEQIKTSGQGGRRIALAGIALGAFWILLGLLVFLSVGT